MFLGWWALLISIWMGLLVIQFTLRIGDGFSERGYELLGVFATGNFMKILNNTFIRSITLFVKVFSILKYEVMYQNLCIFFTFSAFLSHLSGGGKMLHKYKKGDQKE